MNKIIFFCIVSGLMLTSACTYETTVSDNCVENTQQCEGNTLYQCLGGKTPKNESVSYWVKMGVCANSCNLAENRCECKFGVDQFGKELCDLLGNKKDCVNGNESDGSCRCPPECTNGCEANGLCKCSLECSNGCDSTYSVCCDTTCQNGCDISGKCLCPKDSDGKACPNGCDSSGKTCCDEQCKAGCNMDGSCKCSQECSNGCDSTYSVCCDATCQNGCDISGKCLCPKDSDGRTCPNGCDSSGKTCCDEQCKNGCNIDGSCISACVIDCSSSEYCDESNQICKLIDANWNHMDDRREDAPNQGADCRENKDCNTGGYYKGFCDSYLGYKCSTRCTSDDQCVDNESDDFHYVCRKDGRCAPDEFVTVWDLTDSSFADNAKFQKGQPLALYPVDASCDIAIDWGDGNKCGQWGDGSDSVLCCDNSLVFNLNHTYTEPGEYTIRIKGNYKFIGRSDKDNLLYIKPHLKEVKSFGPVGLGESSFKEAINLARLSDVDIPDSSQLSSMNRMFENAESLNKNDDPWIIPLENWDVSNVQSMDSTFSGSTFNQPIGKWNVTNVTDMNSMFFKNIYFNQPIDTWNVSHVTNMSNLFCEAASFNQPLSSWDVSNVDSMHEMFHGAVAFDQPIENWNVSNVTNMGYMFCDATSFNQPIGNWKVSKVTDTVHMFENAKAFNQPLKWDVSNVENLANMFSNASSFNQDLSHWSLKEWITNGQSGTKILVDNILNGTNISEENYCKTQSAWIKECTEAQPKFKDYCEKIDIAEDKEYTCSSE